VSVPQPVTSRRTALGGALAGIVALAGCDLDRESEAPTSQQTTVPPADADADLVADVLQRIVDTTGVVAAARRADQSLRRGLRPFHDLHEAHIRALNPPAGMRTTITSGRPTLDKVRRTELALQDHLTRAAVRAESGALAKLLASMAAGVAQHLAVLG
jgi:hypothetical protein